MPPSNEKMLGKHKRKFHNVSSKERSQKEKGRQFKEASRHEFTSYVAWVHKYSYAGTLKLIQTQEIKDNIIKPK